MEKITGKKIFPDRILYWPYPIWLNPENIIQVEEHLFCIHLARLLWSENYEKSVISHLEYRCISCHWLKVIILPSFHAAISSTLNHPHDILGILKALADLGGACRVHATPYGTQFFHFHIHFHQKCLRRGSMPPLTGPRPPTGNPGSATEKDVLLLIKAKYTITHIWYFLSVDK